MRDHRSSRSLAVSPRHRDAVPIEPHQLGKHFGSRYHRNLSLTRRDYFRIVVAHRARNHHHVRADHILSAVTLKYRRTHTLKPLGDRRRLEIAAGHSKILSKR